MKNIMFFLFITALLAVAGCNNNSDFVATYKCDVNGKGDWINCKTLGNYGGVKGDYCSKVDSSNEYSLGFSKLMSEISPHQIKRISVSVWVKLTDLSKTSSLVVQVSNANNENILWSSHDLNPLVKDVNQWCRIDVEDVLPDYETEGARAGIYVWNPNKTMVYIDNYEIRFLQE
jgi:hypothetical protein